MHNLNGNPSMPTVSIIQEYILSYRLCFFEQLHARLEDMNVNLQLHYDAQRSTPDVLERLPWSTPVRTRRVGALAWQSVWTSCHDSDLVICPQQVRHPASILLQLTRGCGPRKHAFWGHGRNFKAGLANAPSESLKRFLSRRVDWWFAYNEFSADIVAGLGYPGDRITDVRNSVDTTALKKCRSQVTQEEMDELKRGMGIESSNIAVYTGALRAPKRIAFLLEACAQVRLRVPDFHLLMIGDGEDMPMVRTFAGANPWVHVIGALHGNNKVPYWALSKLLLMPGGVGLVILDAFALEVPMVTTENRLHGPEISYLRNRVNGLMVAPGDSVAAYAEAVAGLLENDEELATLRQGCTEEALKYSTEDMCRRFAGGVMEALEAPRYRVFS